MADDPECQSESPRDVTGESRVSCFPGGDHLVTDHELSVVNSTDECSAYIRDGVVPDLNSSNLGDGRGVGDELEGRSRKIGQVRRLHFPAAVLEHRGDLGSRLAWTLAGVVLLNWSIQLLGAVTTYSWVALVVVVSGAAGLAVVTLCWLPGARSASLRRWQGSFGWLVVLLALCCYGVWSFIQVHAGPAYGTDEIAFDQYAALLARHGLDPYTHSMAPAFSLYQVSPDGFTYHLNGTPVTTLSYPSLSFLPYVPLLMLGWSTQAAVVVNALAWAAAIILLFVVLPRDVRALAVVVGSVAAYCSYAIGGVTDMMYLPLLMGAAYDWDGFVHRKSVGRYLAPVFLGLAMSIKQTPWLVAPFLLTGIICEARSVRNGRATAGIAVRYVGAAFMSFLIPNIPYIVMGWRAWLQGILTPLSSAVVPAGQGLVGLSLFLRLGGGSIEAYSILAVVVLVALLVGYGLSYPRMRPVTFVLPSVVLFFASRSFGSYLIALVPVLFVGALSDSRRRFQRRQPERRTGVRGGLGLHALRTWVRHVLIGVVVVALVATIGFSLLSKPFLRLSVTGVRTTGQLATVEQLSVYAMNQSRAALRPHFTVDEGGAVTTFWQVASGPRILQPGAAATYTLRAPNFPAQPPIGGGFELIAFTTHPASVSESAAYVPGAVHLALEPAAVNAPVSLGSAVHVTARILDQFDQPIHEGGIPVYLGQIIYDQRGLVYSEAVINGALPGETPVTAYTNSLGVATFDIVGTQASSDPVYFEANLVSATQFYPYGYSDILAIRFKSAR